MTSYTEQININKLKRLLTHTLTRVSFLEVENSFLRQHLDDALTNVAINKDSIQLLLRDKTLKKRSTKETKMMQVVAKLTEENMNLQNELNKVQKDFERCRSQILFHSQKLEEQQLSQKDQKAALDLKIAQLELDVKDKLKNIENLKQIIGFGMEPPSSPKLELRKNSLKSAVATAKQDSAEQRVKKLTLELENVNSKLSKSEGEKKVSRKNVSQALQKEVQRCQGLIERVIQYCEGSGSQDNSSLQMNNGTFLEKSLPEDKNMIYKKESRNEQEFLGKIEDSEVDQEIGLLSPMRSPLPIKVTLEPTHEKKKKNVPALDLGKVKSKYPPIAKQQVQVKGKNDTWNLSKISMKNSQNALHQSTQFSIMGAFTHIEETKPKIKAKKIMGFLNR